MRTADEEHGGENNVPDDYDFEQTDVITNTKNGGNTSSTSRENYLYLCHHCNDLYKEERGYKMHLSQVDDAMHPDNLTIEDEDYTLIPADENYDPLMSMDDIYQITKNRRRRGEILSDL